jgi:DNA-binding MarR family transcriptional regulator
MFSEQQVIASDLYELVIYLHKNCNNDLFDAVAELDLSLTQIKVLHYLEQSEEAPLSLKDLAALIPVSLPAASRAVDELVQRGLVTRSEDDADRRIKRVDVTAAGRQVSIQLAAARLSGFEQFAATLSSDERTDLAHALSTLLRREEIAACRPTGDRTA